MRRKKWFPVSEITTPLATQKTVLVVFDKRVDLLRAASTNLKKFKTGHRISFKVAISLKYRLFGLKLKLNNKHKLPNITRLKTLVYKTMHKKSRGDPG